MAAQTILFDFTVDKERTGDAKERQEIAKLLRHELEHIFPQLEMAFQMPMDDGYFAVWAENKETFITVRIFPQGLVTINVEYYLEDGKEQLMSFDSSKRIENNIAKKLKVFSGQVLPTIKRGDVARYFPSSVLNQKIYKQEEDVVENVCEEDYFADNDPLDSLLIEMKEEITDDEDDDVPLIQRKKKFNEKNRKRKRPKAKQIKIEVKTEVKTETPNDDEKPAKEYETDEMPSDEFSFQPKKRNREKKYARKHECGVCNKIYEFQFDLIKHIKELHPNDNAIKCRNCSECFATTKLLYRHRKVHKQFKKPHMCEFCSNTFGYKHHLERHLRTHTNERPYKCDLCGNAYKENKDLRLHKMSHTNELPVSCKVCGKGFKENKTLNLHTRRAHMLEPHERPYSCALCGKSYKERKDLNLHHKNAHMEPVLDFFAAPLFK